MENSLDIKIGKMFCKLSEILAPMISSYCFIRFYQPEQPDGLKEFVNDIKKKGEMKRKIFALVMCGIILLSESTVFANNCKNRDLPNKKVGFEFSKAAETGLRRKEDTTSHYIKNESGFDLWVLSRTADDKNKTVNGYAIIPSNTQRRIRNRIKEDGYNWCKLNITSAKSGVSGNIKGVWSPDSIGKYTAAN